MKYFAHKQEVVPIVPVSLFDWDEPIHPVLEAAAPAEQTAVAVYEAEEPMEEFVVDLPVLLDEEGLLLDEMPVAPNLPMTVYWREAEYVASCIAPNTLTVVLRRQGQSILIVPANLRTAAELLMQIKLDQAIPSNWVSRKRPGILEVAIADLLDNEQPMQSKVVVGLEAIGFTVVIPPSLLGWAPRAFRRRQREQTPFDLPIIPDTRPLFERMELGMVLQCTAVHPKFSKPGLMTTGYNFVVTETDEIDSEAGETEESKQATGSVTLMREGGTKAFSWTALEGPMEPYFKLDADLSQAFDPAKTFPKVYPELYQQARQKIEKLKLPLFEHLPHDLAQAFYYRKLLFTDPPRMGKTSKIIASAELSGVKKALHVTVSNGIRVFKREFERLGIKDYHVIKTLADLNHPAKHHIVAQSWLKTCGREAPDTPKHDTKCIRCQGPLMRPARLRMNDEQDQLMLDADETPTLKLSIGYTNGIEGIAWTGDGGYYCRNPECTAHGLHALVRTVTPARSKKQLALSTGIDLFGPGSYITDLDFKQHQICVDKGIDKFEGRRCARCGYIRGGVWIPPRYKRVGKRYGFMSVDEIHHIKSGTSLQASALLAMNKSGRRIGASGTLMPTKPRDAFYPSSWVFGNKNHLFPFSHRTKGVQEFNDEYTTSITMVSSTNSTYKKAVPYIKRPLQYWQWRASKMLFRHYADPLVLAAFKTAGLVIPQLTVFPTVLVPDPKQGVLLVATIADFDTKFKEYSAELKKKTSVSNEGQAHLINSAQVLARMQMMKYASSLPGLLNEKVMANGSKPIYSGSYGGVKVDFIKNKVAEKVELGEKVVIFSDHKRMQSLLAEELAYYHPIHFQSSWSQSKKDESFDRFADDSSIGVFIGGPRSVNESIDLSANGLCRTVILPDLLWSPGMQSQAWSRILTPKPVNRECEMYVLLTKYSIDSHIYSTFYSRIAAADQALYGKLLTKHERSFDVQFFVDQILAEKDVIMQWLIESGESEMEFLPIFHTLSQLSGRGED